jgi:hypothetical protein
VSKHRTGAGLSKRLILRLFSTDSAGRTSCFVEGCP